METSIQRGLPGIFCRSLEKEEKHVENTSGDDVHTLIDT